MKNTSYLVSVSRTTVYRVVVPGAKVVILGAADLDALKDPRYRWVAEHWAPYALGLPAQGVHA